jgi:hypothetical protein
MDHVHKQGAREMGDNIDKKRSEADAELEREIRKERKFTLAEAIGRMAGPGAMKGVSPITRKQQAVIEIDNWLRQHMATAEAELQVVLVRLIEGSEVLLSNYDQPLAVLAACCQRVLDSDDRLRELVREADVEWGRVFGERPRFDVAGSAPRADDPYTFESVRKTLSAIVKQLGPGNA